MANLFKAAAIAFLLVLSGCALNKPVSTAEHYQAHDSVKPASSISLYIYPQPDSAGAGNNSGYFVEFDFAEKSAIPTIKYQD